MYWVSASPRSTQAIYGKIAHGVLSDFAVLPMEHGYDIPGEFIRIIRSLNLGKSEKHPICSLTNTWHLICSVSKHRYLNRSVALKIARLDIFPRSDIFTRFTQRILNLKSRKAFIIRLFTSSLFYPWHQYLRLHMAGVWPTDVSRQISNHTFAGTCQPLYNVFEVWGKISLVCLFEGTYLI